MSDEDERPEVDPAVAARLDETRRVFAKKLRAGTATAKDIHAFFLELERYADAAGWNRPEVREQLRQGRYRGPGFVIQDEIGYDRDLAKQSVGPGWAGLIDEIFDRRDREYPQIRIVQVKEKYGGLRVYVEGPAEQFNPFNELVDAIEHRSYLICEQCGKPGVLRQGGWVQTLCDEHAEGRPPFPPERHRSESDLDG